MNVTIPEEELRRLLNECKLLNDQVTTLHKQCTAQALTIRELRTLVDRFVDRS